MDQKIFKDMVKELKLIRKELSRNNDILLLDTLSKENNLKSEGENK